MLCVCVIIIIAYVINFIMDFLLSLLLNQTQIAQSSKTCVEAVAVGAVVEEVGAWAPNVIAWVFPHEKYEKFNSETNKSGVLYYEISSTPKGWTRASNVKVVECE